MFADKTIKPGTSPNTLYRKQGTGSLNRPVPESFFRKVITPMAASADTVISRKAADNEDWVQHDGKMEYDSRVTDQKTAEQYYGTGATYRAPGYTYGATGGATVELGQNASFKTNGIGAYTKDNGQGPADNATPWEVGWEWLTGSDVKKHSFKDGDTFTELLKTHEHIAATRVKIAADIANGGPLEGDNNYGLGGTQGVGKYIKDYSTLFTGGMTGNIAVTYLGSYSLHYKVDFVNPDGNAGVSFHVSNSSTIESATHPPVIGYTETWSEYVGKPLNDFFSSGPLSKTTQTFDWHENIKWK